MIFKLKFDDGRIDFCTAKDILHLLKSYDAEFDLPLQEIESIREIPDGEAKLINIQNTEYQRGEPEDFKMIPLFDFADDDEFAIIASTEFFNDFEELENEKQ